MADPISIHRQPPFAKPYYLLEQDLATACVGPFASKEDALMHPTPGSGAFIAIPDWVYDLIDQDRISIFITPEDDLAGFINGRAS